MGFIASKKWELLLAAASPFVLAILDAYQTGAFHGKSVADGLVVAALIVLRAAASHQQTPTGTPATVNVPTTTGSTATVATVPPVAGGGTVPPSP